MSTVSDHTLDLLDPLVVNPGRLGILMALASPAQEGRTGVEFVDLRRQTRLTDGNLACHARRLAEGGLIDVVKQFRSGKPVTTYSLTHSGRSAIEAHVERLMTALRPAERIAPAITPSIERMPQRIERDEEDWID